MNRWAILISECPKLFKHGIIFECGLGWHDIIRNLSIKIEAILDKYAEDHRLVEGEENEYIEMFAVQVKEKYGTLRFYMSRKTEEISTLIGHAEFLSAKTCESCGAEGKRRGISWFEVRCDKCYEEEKCGKKTCQ